MRPIRRMTARADGQQIKDLVAYLVDPESPVNK